VPKLVTGGGPQNSLLAFEGGRKGQLVGITHKQHLITFVIDQYDWYDLLVGHSNLDELGKIKRESGAFFEGVFYRGAWISHGVTLGPSSRGW